jgi:hypothetical protein
VRIYGQANITNFGMLIGCDIGATERLYVRKEGCTNEGMETTKKMVDKWYQFKKKLTI